MQSAKRRKGGEGEEEGTGYARIAAAERELQAREKALSITDKGADDNDVIEVEDDDERRRLQ